MSSQSPYLKKLHGVALQGVVNDLVQEKEEGWKGRTSRDSYTTKLQCLELMGIKITKDALYKRVERQSKKQPNARTRPIEEQRQTQMIPKCHPCHLHLQEVTQTLCPQQVDLRVLQIRRREKTSKITKNE